MLKCLWMRIIGKCFFRLFGNDGKYALERQFSKFEHMRRQHQSVEFVKTRYSNCQRFLLNAFRAKEIYRHFTRISITFSTKWPLCDRLPAVTCSNSIMCKFIWKIFFRDGIDIRTTFVLQKLGSIDRNIWLIVLYAILGTLAGILSSCRIAERRNYGLQWVFASLCHPIRWSQTEFLPFFFLVMGKAEGHGDNWHGHVTALTVSPDYRRLGLAATLMNFLEDVSEK